MIYFFASPTTIVSTKVGQNCPAGRQELARGFAVGHIINQPEKSMLKTDSIMIVVYIEPTLY